MTTHHFFKLLAWLSLAFVIFATISPIGLRPHDLLPVDIDRALAFAAMTALFVIAYPRHFILCAVLLIVGAGAIELLQYLSPTRHAHAMDASVKAVGAALGACIGWGVSRMLARDKHDQHEGGRPARS